MLITAGGNITLADLEGYVSTVKNPLKLTLTNGNYTLYNGPPPASGSVLSFIVAILDGMCTISLYIKLTNLSVNLILCLRKTNIS